jgi:hypothetical protein
MQFAAPSDLGAQSVEVSDLQSSGNPVEGCGGFPSQRGGDLYLQGGRLRGWLQVGFGTARVPQGLGQGVAPARLVQFPDSTRGQPKMTWGRPPKGSGQRRGQPAKGSVR